MKTPIKNFAGSVFRFGVRTSAADHVAVCSGGLRGTCFDKRAVGGQLRMPVAQKFQE